MNENNLFPCPFCNGRAELTDSVCDVMVHCTRCFTKLIKQKSNGIATFNAKKLAIESWNTRKQTKE